MRHKILPLFLLLLCAPAGAAEKEPLAFSGRYDFAWNGVKFGEMEVTATETPNRRSAESDIRLTGLGRLFSGHQSVSTLTAGGGGPVETAPRTFESRYSTRGKPKRIKLSFAAGGAVTERVIEPPEPPGKRPAVPAEQMKAALDPLSYLFAVREALHTALEEGKNAFTLRLFEGRRLMETTYRILGRQAATKRMPAVIALSATRRAVTGFTAKELAKMRNEPALRAYFSDDERLIPLRLEAPLLGTLSAALVRSP